MPRRSLGICACLCAPSLLACIDHPVKPVNFDPTAVSVVPIQIEANRDVDILFVLDNSGSMGEEQARLAANFSALIEVLEREDVRALYRIGITTSDVGNPNNGCSGDLDTDPEDGALQLVACRAHLDEDFVFPPPPLSPTVDVRDIACTDICSQAAADALAAGTRPTEVAGDPGGAKSRPWIERLGYGSIDPSLPDTNLPGGLSSVEAFQCVGPQGIAGCGFEGQLEAQFRAIQRTHDQTDPAFGFLRDNAIFASVQVSDEADCSFHRGLSGVASVFSNGGSQVFWEDPMVIGQATSAICWNAGVACTPAKVKGTPQQYDSCAAQDHALDGLITDDPAQAVLWSLSRYTAQFDALEQDKAEAGAGAIIVTGILGVPVSDPWAIVYEDEGFSSVNDGGHFDATQALNEQALFGIGKGCVSNPGSPGFQSAVPPVRMRDFIARYATTNDDGQPTDSLFSICADSYVGAMEQIAGKIIAGVRPGCYPECARDLDEASAGLQPSCTVVQTLPSGAQAVVEACEEGGIVPEGALLCYVMKTRDAEPGQVGLSEECELEGWNLEFDIVRAAPAPSGAAIQVGCVTSPIPQVDCPELFD